MQSVQLSPLETALATVFHELYGDKGFPAPNRIRVLRRENTGAGRYVDVDSDDHIALDDGYVDLGGRYIKMSEVPHGLMAVALIKNHRVRQIEIAVYGVFIWDGIERDWSISAPPSVTPKH
jgi:hypothetical protein